MARTRWYIALLLLIPLSDALLLVVLSQWIQWPVIVALVVLLFAIGQRLVRLIREVRANAPGARLRARLVGVFIALALPPVVVVYLFSVEFLNNTISDWFDTGAEPALADSIELGQLFLDLRTRQAQAELARIAAAMPRQADEDRLLDYLFSRVSSSGPVALTTLTRLYLPSMVSRGHGRILNMGSIASFQPGPLLAVVGRSGQALGSRQGCGERWRE